MKSVNALVLTLILLVCIGLIGERKAHGVAVNDQKSIPGTSCVYFTTNYLPMSGYESYLPYLGGPGNGSGTQLGAPPWSGTLSPPYNTYSWVAICPLTRDNPTNAAGLNGVSVDVGDFTINGPDGGNEECWVTECNQSGSTCSSGAHGLVVVPANTNSSVNLTMPSGNFGGGYAAVACKMSIWGTIRGVRYSEPGGNSTDW